MKEIQLTQGKIAIIDDEDYFLVNSYHWHAKKDKEIFYAATNIGKGTNRRTIRMHNLIMGFAGIDHKDRNGLDNRRQNLRHATLSQNRRNSIPAKGRKFKGVYKYWNKWISSIKANRKSIHIGLFKTEIEAAKAYDLKAKELFGEFARLNFPTE